MDRKDFLSSIGLSAAALLVGGCLGGCEKEDAPNPASVDFTIDLSQSEFASLRNIGGSVYKNNIIIAKNNNGTIVAFTQFCNHEGAVLNYVNSTNPFYFRCPRHGATFEQNGNGTYTSPGVSSLYQYTVTQDTNNSNLFRIH